mmetsp:Transcript_35649/g.101596  ORF Transcript_35649/g.101596 Transcript_35649/m.101596 type:complete len:224 (+) Transcript_35649:70-741(+)
MASSNWPIRPPEVPGDAIDQWSVQTAYPGEMISGPTLLTSGGGARSHEASPRPRDEGTPRRSRRITRHCVRRILLIGTATVLFLAVVDVFFFLCVTLSESGMNLQQPSGLALFLCLVLSTQTVVVGAVLYFMTRMPDVQRPKAVTLPAEVDKNCPPRTDQEGACVICLEDVTLGEPSRGLACGHVLHVECVDAWWKAQRTAKDHKLRCPTCRRPVYEEATHMA